jgi:heme exporter protein C
MVLRHERQMLPWLAAAGALLLVIGLAWGLAFALPDYQQGNSFRIIYIHVPAALADVALRQAASIGAWMTVSALTSGAIWGKPTWGAYWVWDARLTSMLILLFLYLGVIALGQAIANRDSAARGCAVLAVNCVVRIRAKTVVRHAQPGGKSPVRRRLSPGQPCPGLAR